MFILPFSAPAATLASAGGKGANLARLTRAGFPVPHGFIITTEAYHAFVVANNLAHPIASALQTLIADDAGGLERASTKIRGAFSAGVIPAATEAAIRHAYEEFNGAPVAVRSSATAEDLPDLSFAGQQETYLNVLGEAQVLRAVVDCWSSLWTARAIGYRLRNGIRHDEAALAVVVQAMIHSEVSGVLFTANPLSGLLSESVVDATFGLGEALVAGQVEPDHFVVDVVTQKIRSHTLGAKRLSTRGKPGGGVETIPEQAAARQTLNGDELRQLVTLGQQVQREYGAPQDIEFAFAAGRLYLLQSRAITSLFPVPQVSFDPLIVWFSFGAVQGLTGPLTPLGRDVIRSLGAAVAVRVGVPMTSETIPALVPAGERLWIRISDVIRHPIGNRLLAAVLNFIEPSVEGILRPLTADPRLHAGQGRVKFSSALRVARFFLPSVPWIVQALLHPEQARAEFDTAIDVFLRSAQIAPAADRYGRLAATVAFIRERLARVLAYLVPHFVPMLGPSLAALRVLAHLAGDTSLALEATRGLPRNVTTEMDLALWATAQALRAEAESARVFDQLSARELAQRYLNGALPAAAQAAIARFMHRYGIRGVGEIDLGQPRWREDPTPVMHTVQSYLKINPEFAPDVLFAKGEQAAQVAVERLALTVRRQPDGWLKERAVRAAARRLRVLMGARESPKFFAVRMMGVAREALLAAGREFADAGVIDRADDLAFLQLSELEALARDEPRDWQALVAERRAAYERELRRRHVPRVLVSDGRAFYEGLGADADAGDTLTGSPVSPGVAEGVVHIILDPRGAQLAPGEILVCPGTDPAWTPLFMAAGGLITEVGGMMTHGSVVAREYGIPAVVGVHQATIRLKDGQRIRVDGTAGKVVVLDQ